LIWGKRILPFGVIPIAPAVLFLAGRVSPRAALRHDPNGGNEFVRFLVVRNEHHRRDASLFSIAIQFPKLAVVIANWRYDN